MSLLNAFAPEQEVLREPEWMPSAADVARARALLERQGVVRSLSRGLIAPQLVPPGQTPWLWWGAAALWLLLWPAVIALKLGSDRLSWLAWWLPVLLALAHMLVLASPVLFSLRFSNKGELRKRFGKVQTLAQMLALEPAEFETWSGMLFQLMGYQVRNTQYVADHGIDLLVNSSRVRRGLVQCKRYRGTVGEPTVRDLYGTLNHENADYGWLVTTGGVSRQARGWATGKPIELWDGQQLVALASRYR